ncbi:MAG: sigma-70 family RNA polymerase sigma factor [Clostridia bacterium]|nr:sigma-70 family RNA polymerase sigma factor [Clostridia bacterium]
MNNNTALLIQKAQNGDKTAMEALVQENEMLIHKIVAKFLSRGVEREDLFQLGAIGFIKAVNNFDLSRQLALSTYAVPMIMGEIRRFLRDDGPVKVSRSMRELASKVAFVSGEIAREKGREARLSEIAEYLNISQAEVATAISAVQRPDSINRPLGDDENSATLGDVMEDGNRFDEKVVTAVSISQAAEHLSPRDRQIIFLRFYKNYTQTKVAELMGISQVQVSRLEKKIIENLKKLLA